MTEIAAGPSRAEAITGVNMALKLNRLILLLALILATTTVAGCGASSSEHPAGAGEHSVVMADAGAMPASVRAAPQVVQEAYRFAAANQDALEQIPCYCGCGGMGHTSNYACFWQPDGRVDEHALGCGICVDIAQDVRRGLAQGIPLDRIRAQIDADYSRFGPPTDTPAVAAASQ
ncbi:MAG TPA: PCYCGC motif-containing (lipo)protein [Caldilineaceae bacterium]|nr:PCYCGC motif-containing (lipo)protein [Caldilineaceae bacterium]